MTTGPHSLTDLPEAADNFAAAQRTEAASRESAALQERIDKLRNAKERGRKLTGVGLGEEEEGAVKAEEQV